MGSKAAQEAVREVAMGKGEGVMGKGRTSRSPAKRWRLLGGHTTNDRPRIADPGILHCNAA